jgi:hypothetical protein
MTDSALTILVSVSNTFERDQLIKRIYSNLTTEPNPTFTIQQDQVNRIKVFHNVGPQTRVLIRTYLVLIIPVLIDLNPLHSIYGNVDFHLDETIKRLTSLANQLKALQGRRLVKGKTNEQITRQLAESLCGTDGKYGASVTVR